MTETEKTAIRILFETFQTTRKILDTSADPVVQAAWVNMANELMHIQAPFLGGNDGEAN